MDPIATLIGRLTEQRGMLEHALDSLLDESHRHSIGEARVRAASEVQAAAPPEPLPPGTNNTIDVANQVVLFHRARRAASERQREFYETSSSYILPPFGPLRARHPAP